MKKQQTRGHQAGALSGELRGRATLPGSAAQPRQRLAWSRRPALAGSQRERPPRRGEGGGNSGPGPGPGPSAARCHSSLCPHCSEQEQALASPHWSPPPLQHLALAPRALAAGAHQSAAGSADIMLQQRRAGLGRAGLGCREPSACQALSVPAAAWDRVPAWAARSPSPPCCSPCSASVPWCPAAPATKVSGGRAEAWAGVPGMPASLLPRLPTRVQNDAPLLSLVRRAPAAPCNFPHLSGPRLVSEGLSAPLAFLLSPDPCPPSLSAPLCSSCFSRCHPRLFSLSLFLPDSLRVLPPASLPPVAFFLCQHQR